MKILDRIPGEKFVRGKCDVVPQDRGGRSATLLPKAHED
jgi:hypothetical protein